jgi:dipeptidyl aminopeptidase/acylaminoacyl peptidase
MTDDDTDVLEELASLPTMAHPTASPEGDAVALYYDDSGRNELHVIDVESGERARWSDGQVPRNARWHVEWSADGERVFFHLDEGGNEQNDIHAIDRDGEAEAVVTSDGQNALRDVGPDGETLLVGSTREGQMNLYVHDLDSSETERITDYDRAVWGGTIGPDGERIAYASNETDDPENIDAYVADIDGSDARKLPVGEIGAETAPVDWGPDGERLLLSDNTEDRTRVGVYDLDSEAVRWYGTDEEESPTAFTEDGERVLATRERDAAVMPVVYDVETGEGRELDLPEGVAAFGSPMGGSVTVGEDRVLLTHTTPTRRPELLVYDLDSDETETLLEPDHGPFSPEEFADAEYFTVDSDGVPETPAEAVDHDPYDTLEIGALLYDPGTRPAPLIVNPHGGPRGQDQKRFDLYTQFLAQQGYAVLKVNYRGSTGRGRAFMEELYGDWGGAEQGDVAIAAESVLDREWIDDDRVAVFGGSYGGYSSYWQLVQYPDLYDAGIAWIGLTDLERMYEDTMPHFKTELMERYLGTPEENPEIYAERSPIRYAGNLAAPLFMLHGVNDRRVPVSQARIFRERLEELGYEGGEGGDFEYHELGEEGHASSDQDQKLRLFRLLSDFLDRRLRSAVPADD